MNGAGEVDVEMLLARIRERVHARRSPAPSGSDQPAVGTEAAGTGQDVGGDPLQAEFDQSVAGAVVRLAQHIRSGQRGIELLQEWVRAETERAGQREWEMQVQLRTLARAMTLMNERQDHLEAAVRPMAANLDSGESSGHRSDLLQAALEFRSAIDLLIARLGQPDQEQPVINGQARSTTDEVGPCE